MISLMEKERKYTAEYLIIWDTLKMEKKVDLAVINGI